jgi:predicted  nucleic acid-binding Zn-ribbon protein
VFASSDGVTTSTKKFKTGSIKKKTAIMPLKNDDIKIDNKITDEEKRQFNAIVDQANQYTNEQAAALNKVPGVQVSADDLKEKKKNGPGLNPIKWLFGPVIRLQEQSVKLEQQIMKLTGPIAALQPGMLSLENRITSMQTQLGHLENTTGSVEDELTSIRQDIASMHATLTEIKKPVTDLKSPIMSLHDPILNIEKPIVGVDKDLNEVKLLLRLVLTAICAVCLIIPIVTPIAAILVWRNKEKLLPKPNADQYREEQDIKQATKVMDHQIKS